MIINSQLGGKKPTGKYQLLDRVKDDSNNEIGTVCGFRKDSNNNEYAVVCLDAAKRRTNSSTLLTNAASEQIPDLPMYPTNQISMYSAPETATYNCDKILSYASSVGGSIIISYCRNLSFVIDSVTYAGQVPSLPELLLIMAVAPSINSLDPTSSSYPQNIITNGRGYWSSTQSSVNNIVGIFVDGSRPINQGRFNSYQYVLPILELPNA